MVPAWRKDTDEFSHTVLILQDNDDVFYASTPQRYRSDADVDVQKLSLSMIPPAHIWPAFPRDLTQASEPISNESFIERPDLSAYDEEKDSRIAERLLSEVKICERLRQYPHPNIAQYLGCVVHKGRITGLCFRRYGETLMERVRGGILFDREACLSGIESGIRHLHKLGLIHNDISPLNIMLATDDTAVIIDFDSCGLEGAKLGSKGGTYGWTDESATICHQQNDYYGSMRLREFFYGKENGR